MDQSNPTEVIVIGAGHAGLSTSYYLKQHGVDHIVLERGQVAESWRSQRWDSFKLNTANRFNVLPGKPYTGDGSDPFGTADEFVSMLKNYVLEFQLPVIEKTKVISIEKDERSHTFDLTVLQNGNMQHYWSNQVIIASGIANEKKIPSFAKKMTTGIKQLHSSEYRNPTQLPAGAVLVTGGAQSGVQIAEDLADAGRKVFLSTSMVARIPRFYRGKDCMEWLNEMRFFDMRAEDITDPVMLNLKPPQLTGTRGKQSISLQSLAKKGVVILGKMENASEHTVFFQPNAATHVKFADQFSANVKKMIDEFISKNELTAASPDPDEEDRPDTDAACACSITSLDLQEQDIRSIVWTTGFNADFSYIKLPVLNAEGFPEHKEGSSPVEGLYFVGLPWLRSRKSSIIFGLKEDAEFIAQQAISHSSDRRNANVAAG